jgi:hypothetical protein
MVQHDRFKPKRSCWSRFREWEPALPNGPHMILSQHMGGASDAKEPRAAPDLRRSILQRTPAITDSSRCCHRDG